MKVFSISNRNSENRELHIVGNITTILVVRAVGKRRHDALLSNNYPKERQQRNLRVKLKLTTNDYLSK